MGRVVRSAEGLSRGLSWRDMREEANDLNGRMNKRVVQLGPICLFILAIVLIVVYVTRPYLQRAKAATQCAFLVNLLAAECADATRAGVGLPPTNRVAEVLASIPSEEGLFRRNAEGGLIDVWGNSFAVEVAINDQMVHVCVLSGGQDGQIDTDDDIEKILSVPVQAVPGSRESDDND